MKKLPDELPETPYQVGAYRIHHYHLEEDDPAYPGTFVVELAGHLPGTEAEVLIPFEMTADMVVGLIDELMHQYRCVAVGLPDEEDDGIDDEP